MTAVVFVANSSKTIQNKTKNTPNTQRRKKTPLTKTYIHTEDKKTPKNKTLLTARFILLLL